jgi:hypothetical protein
LNRKYEASRGTLQHAVEGRQPGNLVSAAQLRWAQTPEFLKE